MRLKAEEAEELLSAVVRLRETWQHMVELKLLGDALATYFRLQIK